MSDIDDDAPTYPASQARMQQFQANSLAAGAGGVPGGPLSQGAAPVAAAPLSANPYGLGGGYAQLYALAQQQAQEQQKARQSYLASLQQQEGALGQQGMSDYDRASLLFQAAGALGQPTRSGGFGETLGNLGTAMAGPLSKQAEAQRQRQTQLQQLQMARQKLAMEMSGSGQPSVSDTLALMKAQQEAQPKLTDTQRLLQDQSLTPEERKAGLRKALKLDSDETDGGELKTITLPDKTQFSVKWMNGRPYDPISGQPIDPARMKAVEDATRATEEADRKTTAAATGIPMPERDMLANIKNPKIREAQQAKMMEEARKILMTEEVKNPSSGIEEDMRQAQEFMDINAQHQNITGPKVGMLPLQVLPKEAELLDKIAIGLSRKLRQIGEGNMSNYDAQQFAKAFMSRSNDYEINRNIGTGFVNVKQLELDRRDFFNAYAEQNGTLQGAQSHWKKYLEANPVFDKAKTKGVNIAINENRMGWQDYFRKEMGPKGFVRDENGKLILDQGQRP